MKKIKESRNSRAHVPFVVEEWLAKRGFFHGLSGRPSCQGINEVNTEVEELAIFRSSTS
jgi:hypothetical protein